jgi:acylphosphatase
MKKQVHVLYSGRVQGVGFRYTAREIADEQGAVGWVRNMQDGRVELVVEAEEARLTEILARIMRSFGDYIRQTDVEWGQATGEFRDFRILISG